MKTSSPYFGSGIDVKSPPDTIKNEQSKAGSKAKARYPDKPISTNQSAGGPSGNKTYARSTPMDSVPGT